MNATGRWIMFAALVAVGIATAGRPLAARAAGGSTPLHAAVKQGDTTGVRALLGQGADVNAPEADGSTPLHWAVYGDSVELAQVLIRAGANVRTANRYGVTPLALACLNGSAPIVEALIAAGADPNGASPEGETVLMTAARTGSLAAVTLLLRHGAEVNAVEHWRGQTALMWAAAQGHARIVETLVEAGADVQARSKTRAPYAALPGGIDPLYYYFEAASARPVPRNTDPPVGPPGFTPLLFAARAGHLEAVRALLAAGANPNDILSDGTSALVLAVLNAHYEIAKVLVEQGADPNADLQGWTALHQLVWTRRPAVQRSQPSPLPTGEVSDLELVKVLAARGANLNARQKREPDDANRHAMDRAGATAFLLAAKAADVEMMRALVAAGADPLLTTAKGATPLMAAAGVGIWRIGESAGTNAEALEAVKLALELGGDVNAADADGDTALHGAAHRGATPLVQFLYDRGAKLDAVNKNGWTALTIAEGVLHPNTYKSEPETEALLRRLGANPLAGKKRPADLLATGAQGDRR